MKDELMIVMKGNKPLSELEEEIKEMNKEDHRPYRKVSLCFFTNNKHEEYISILDDSTVAVSHDFSIKQIRDELKKKIESKDRNIEEYDGKLKVETRERNILAKALEKLEGYG